MLTTVNVDAGDSFEMNEKKFFTPFEKVDYQKKDKCSSSAQHPESGRSLNAMRNSSVFITKRHLGCTLEKLRALDSEFLLFVDINELPTMGSYVHANGYWTDDGAS